MMATSKPTFFYFIVLRTGLEPVSFPVKGGCPNQLDERSVYLNIHISKNLTNIRNFFDISKFTFGGEYWIRTNAPIAR